MSWWSPMDSLAGKEVRNQLGRNYSLLPIADFECPWHRRAFDADHFRRHVEETGRRPEPLPCERPAAWWPSGVRSGALDDAPRYMLPDGRAVSFIFSGERFGSVLKPEWTRVKAAARLARGPLLSHAYEVALEILQRWQLVGIEMIRAQHENTQRIQRGETTQHWSGAFPREDAFLPDWIFVHARDLYRRDPTDPFYIGDLSEDDDTAFEERMRTFKPFERALGVLAAATGYEVSTVKKARERERRRLLGGGAVDRRRGKQERDLSS